MPTKKTEPAKFKDTMRAEYDMRSGVRGKYAGMFQGDIRMVALDPDVAAVFSDSESVNDALRLILKAAKAVKPAGKRKSA